MTGVESDILEMQTLALRLAQQAAEISLSRIERARATQKFDRSIVTSTDHEIQAMIVREIHDEYPDHVVCAEETAPRPHARIALEGARYCWVIDPLDGTRNYVARLLCFSTSIAILDNGVPVVGVIHEHNTRQLFSAMHGGGARLNGAGIRVNDFGPDREHLLGVPSSKDEMALCVSRAWQATRGYVCRNLGSTAFEMGLISCGAMSGMLGRRVKIWDIAAGALLISEAGGVVSDPTGATLVPFRMDIDPQQDIPMLAGCARMHPVLLDSIRAAMA